MSDVLATRRGCPTYGWCAGHTSGDDDEHRGVPVDLPTTEGRDVRLTLVAYGSGVPLVEVDLLLTPGGLPLPVAGLHPGTLAHAAEALCRHAEGGPRLPLPREPT